MGKEAERLLTAGPRALRFVQLTVESQSRVSGPFRVDSGASGRMAWRGGSKGMSQSTIPQIFLQGLPGARP